MNKDDKIFWQESLREEKKLIFEDIDFGVYGRVFD